MQMGDYCISYKEERESQRPKEERKVSRMEVNIHILFPLGRNQQDCVKKTCARRRKGGFEKRDSKVVKKAAGITDMGSG